MNLADKKGTIISLHLNGKSNDEIQAVVNLVYPGFETNEVNYH